LDDFNNTCDGHAYKHGSRTNNTMVDHILDRVLNDIFDQNKIKYGVGNGNELRRGTNNDLLGGILAT
jgi:hypothetical protein